MIPRNVEKYVREILKVFSIIIMTEPRQSGKITLERAIFSGRPYASSGSQL